MMKPIFVLLVLIAGLVSNPIHAAVTEDDFKVKTTANLVNLCRASPSDPQYREAIHFCHGYLVGAFHYNRVEAPDMLCIPKPHPTRNQAIDQFIAWTQKHPEYRNELPVETEFRFLLETWPCKADMQKK